MQNVLVAPDLSISEPLVPARISVDAVGWPEWVIMAFLFCAAGGLPSFAAPSAGPPPDRPNPRLLRRTRAWVCHQTMVSPPRLLCRG